MKKISINVRKRFEIMEQPRRKRNEGIQMKVKDGQEGNNNSRKKRDLSFLRPEKIEEGSVEREL